VHEAFVKAEISQISSRWPPRAAVANRLGKIADTAEKLLELLTGELPSNDETGSEENRELVSSSNRIRYAIEEIAGADPRVLHGMLDGLPKLADVAKRARDWARAEPKEGLELALEREQGPGIGRPRGSGDAFNGTSSPADLPDLMRERTQRHHVRSVISAPNTSLKQVSAATQPKLWRRDAIGR
jgi:hypothetical protein